MEEKLNKVKELLKQNHQEHLLTFYDDLNTEDKEKLLDQILGIDFNLMNKLYENTKKEIDIDTNSIEPISYVDKSKLEPADSFKYTSKGIDAIKQGKLAVVTMAGGQGTRLGHKGPKGTFDLGLDSHK